LQVVWVIIDQF